MLPALVDRDLPAFMRWLWDAVLPRMLPVLRLLLTKNVHTFNLGKVGFHEVGSIAKDVARAPTLRAKLGYIFAPPGWSHDGSSQTATQLRALFGKSGSVVPTDRPLD